jgi:hypothetical protein
MKSSLTRMVRLNAVSVVARSHYEKLFDKGGSLEGGFCRVSCSLSRFLVS